MFKDPQLTEQNVKNLTTRNKNTTTK